MPFKSKRQRRWMYANHPEMAQRWEEHTPKSASLPESVAPKPESPDATEKEARWLDQLAWAAAKGIVRR